MKKQTFKVGDRVESVGYVNSKASKVEYGKVVEVTGCGVAVNFDRKDVNRSDGRWYLGNNKVQHDTNFQVGDWVRYEAVEPYAEGYDTENGKVGQITHLGQEFATIKGELFNQERFIRNLVKIQPPQEARAKPIKIKHEKYGVVEGVNVLQGGLDYGFAKDGAHYFCHNGWSQVSETEWVTIQVEKEGFGRLKKYENLYGYSVKAYDNKQYTKWRYPQ